MGGVGVGGGVWWVRSRGEEGRGRRRGGVEEGEEGRGGGREGRGGGEGE